MLPDAEVLAGHTRVAVDPEGVVVGFATVVGTGPVRELDDLFVEPDHQRHGVGAALVADAVARARRSGAERIEVTGNPHASRFYTAVGFEPDGEVGDRARHRHPDAPRPGRPRSRVENTPGRTWSLRRVLYSRRPGQGRGGTAHTSRSNGSVSGEGEAARAAWLFIRRM